MLLAVSLLTSRPKRRCQTSQALFGAMPAAVLGGVCTVAVALLWMKLFPSLRQVESLE
ncbi:hypothetical protein [Bradyrhizobium genosp. A]|uniref:hypothetical protein n=1 Tax=Bradyrhizobium genosp. A TaxID=83626 RepID=UPI003CF12972